MEGVRNGVYCVGYFSVVSWHNARHFYSVSRPLQWEFGMWFASWLLQENGVFTFLLLAVFFTNSGQHVWRIETWDIFMYFMCYSTDGSKNWYLCSLCTWPYTYQKVTMYGFKIYACFGNTLGADGKWVRSLQQGCWSLKIHAFKCQFCGHWSLNDLEAALKDIRKKKASIQAAGAAHGVPKSTLFDYANWSSWSRQQVWSRWQLPLMSCL